MKKLETFKNVVQVAAGLGVGAIVNCIVENNTSDETGKLKRATIWFAGLILAGMACEKVSTYIDEKFDEVKKCSKQVVEEAKEQKETA